MCVDCEDFFCQNLERVPSAQGHNQQILKAIYGHLVKCIELRLKNAIADPHSDSDPLQADA